MIKKGQNWEKKYIKKVLCYKDVLYKIGLSIYRKGLLDTKIGAIEMEQILKVFASASERGADIDL